MTEKLSSELARLRRYDEELSSVMPPDFKDWHQNSKEEWPELAAWVIKNLREQQEILKDFQEEIEKCFDVALKLDALNPELAGAFTGTPSERIERQLYVLGILK